MGLYEAKHLVCVAETRIFSVICFIKGLYLDCMHILAPNGTLM